MKPPFTRNRPPSRERQVLLALTLLFLASSPSRAQPSPPGQIPPATSTANPVAVASNRFAVDLYRQLPVGENLFFSPFSIVAALEMLELGARGDTATELRQALYLKPPSEVEMTGEQGVAALLKQLDGAGQPYQLRVVDRIWPQSGYPFRAEFLKLLQTQFAATIEAQDFARAPEAARGAINHWVEVATEHKIKDLIPPGILTPLTRMVLTNAIYFKGSWKSAFVPRATYAGPFHTPSGPRKVQFMRKEETFLYLHEGQVQVLELPYLGDRLSMDIFLPDEQKGLPDLEKLMGATDPGSSSQRGTPGESLRRPPEGGTLEAWLSKLQPARVLMSIPRFKLTRSFSLGQTLQRLGVVRAFSKSADFSGMDGKRDLVLAAVLHKAFVDVNEEGTEAAAATAVVVHLRSVSMEPEEMFVADHPFLFVIRDRVSGVFLFMGRVAAPE